MSILTTLAYAITAAIRPMVRDTEIADLKAQVDDLNGQVTHLENWIADINRDLVDMRIRHAPVRDEQAQYYINEAMRQSIQAQMRVNSQLAQAQMQDAQNLQYGIMLGQAQQFSGWDHCTCVPARHDALLRGH